MRKKKIRIIIGSCICVILVFLTGYYFANRNNSNKNSKTVSSKDVTTKQTDTKQVTSQQKQKQEDNKIEGFDLGVLTKEELHRAESKSSQYKGKEINIEGINMVKLSKDDFKQTYGYAFIIQTPYTIAIDYSKGVAEQYLDVNDKNVVDYAKKDNGNFNTFHCMTIVGGDNIDFVKKLHMVLRVYGKNETKVLQAKSTYGENKSELAKTSPCFPDNPSYMSIYGGLFDAKEVLKLNPQKLEIVVVYPNGKEVKQIFDYNKLNQL